MEESDQARRKKRRLRSVRNEKRSDWECLHWCGRSARALTEE